MTPRALVGLLAVPALAFPTAASADDVLTLASRPIDVHGYRMIVWAKKGGTFGPASLEVELFRARGRGWERDSYWFAKDVRITARRDLSSARVRASLGRFGSIDLTFRDSRPAAGGGLPPSCRGRLSDSRRGVLRGALTLHTRTRFFGTIRVRTLNATAAHAGTVRCSDRALVSGRGIYLEGGADGGAMSFFASQPLRGGVVQSVTVEEAVPSLHAALYDAHIRHTVLVRAPRSTLTNARNLGSAHVEGAGPLLDGSIDFSANGRHVGYGRPGNLTGTLRARFDSIGTVRLFSRGEVSGWLTRRK